jgi:ABC-2 type transport system ATP-binding protein
MEDIERLCKRIVILREGEIVYDGELAKIARSFARHKIIAARLGSEKIYKSGKKSVNLDFLKNFGRILELNHQSIKMQVVREKVAQTTSFILKSYPVLDLNIEEEDIGTIIEAIQKGGKSEGTSSDAEPKVDTSPRLS